MGLRANALIPLGNAGAIVGRLSKRAAAECGLLEGTTVALAGADTQCGLLGMGTVDENQVGVVVGWSAPLQMVTSKPIISPDGRSWTGCHLPTDRWVLECNPGDVGNAYSWLKDITANSDRDDFAAMDRLAQGTPVGSDGALAFLGSSLMDTNRLGLRTGGLLFPVPLTFDAVGRGHLIRAVLEASAYAIKANLLQLEEIASVDARQIAVGGGMTRSQTFLQILADVLGREVLVSSEHQVSALGAALCASIAIGHFGSFEEAASHRDLRAMGPDRLRAAEYLDHYERWLEVSSTLEEL
jgi:autoinducer 2 (AI-2) kinase